MVDHFPATSVLRSLSNPLTVCAFCLFRERVNADVRGQAYPLMVGCVPLNVAGGHASLHVGDVPLCTDNCLQN
jgi:hypothetical protein